SEIFHDFTNPAKFDGMFPAVFDERGVRIYEVPLAGDPRAVVIASAADLPSPTNGIDRPALESYLTAVTRGTAPVTAVNGLGHWRVETQSAGDLIVREAYDSGWQASVDGKSVTAGPDTLGMLRLTLPAGSHIVELDRRVHLDFLAGLAIAALTALFLLIHVIARPGGEAVARTGIVAVVVAMGALLRAWDGFPKGVDAANHLTRLKFVSDWFPNHDWFYVWAAGMPTFDNYPGLAYVMALPAVRAFGAEPTLKGLAFVAMVAFALGLY